MTAVLASALQKGQIAEDEAVAVLTHAGVTARSGLERLTPPIAFWTLPWRALATAIRPLRGLIGLVWKIRPVVVGIAIWESLTDPPAADVGDGVAVAAVMAVALMLDADVHRCRDGVQVVVQWVRVGVESHLASADMGITVPLPGLPFSVAARGCF